VRRLLVPVVATLSLLAACSSAATPAASPAPSAAPSSSVPTASASAAATPADAPVTRSEDRAAKRALFFGDSYFVGGGCSPDRTRDMAAIAGRKLGYTPIVRGYGGTGFVATNPDYDGPDYLTQIAQGSIDVPNVSLVVIEGGDNDVGFKVSDIKRNARKVLKIARAKHPRARLVLMGAMQTYGNFSQTDGINDGLRSVARSLGVPFINPQKWTYGNDQWLCSDYVHPTYAGHQVLGAKLARKLAKRGA
jgi:acyl-CoA thioesterase I